MNNDISIGDLVQHTDGRIGKIIELLESNTLIKVVFGDEEYVYTNQPDSTFHYENYLTNITKTRKNKMKTILNKE